MRIKWSSNEAEEILHQLRSANRAMENCRTLAGFIHSAIEDAGAGEENKAMQKVAAHFSEEAQSMIKLAQKLEEVTLAIQKADELFSESERQIGERAERIIEQGSAPAYTSQMGSRYIDWNEPTFNTIPYMRMDAPMPIGFIELLDEPDIINTIRN